MNKDQAARDRALCVNQSFMVHAPAGSGKTELLVKRYLALLKVVKDPEEIIAITFTKKAAFEMKERVLKALKEGALPARLRILTIDALCAKLARSMPLLSELGDLPAIAKDPFLLYRKAARALLQDEPWSEALWVLARHMQNRLELLEELFAQMLATREQWLETLMAARGHQKNQGLREFLEESMAKVCTQALENFEELCPESLGRELGELLDFSLGVSPPSDSLRSSTSPTREEVKASSPARGEVTTSSPLEGEGRVGGDFLSTFKKLADLCLTKTGTLRKTVDKRSGFPTDSPAMKSRMKECLENLSSLDEVVESLQKIQTLPEPSYSDNDWKVVEALLEVLPLLVSHLQVVFLEKSEVDFSEIALRALRALGDADSPTDLALILDYQIKHILIDEFQDTSPTQFRLLESLVRGWEPEDGRTLFLVGDPMQSIYRFRQADVRLFSEAMEHGVGGVKLEPLFLESNFRSSPEIVNWVNKVFSREAIAVKEFEGEIVWHRGSDSPPSDSLCSSTSPSRGEVKSSSAFEGAGSSSVSSPLEGEGGVVGGLDETSQIIHKIQEIRLDSPGDSIAILGRSRRQVSDILSALMTHQIPTEAVDMQNLSDALVIRDLFSLLYAFSEESDVLSWMSLLRSPWVGLPLEGLLVFSQTLKSLKSLESLKAGKENTLVEPISCIQILKKLFQDSEIFKNSRIKNLIKIYEDAAAKKVDQPLVLWVSEIFEKLGGAGALLEKKECFAVEQFFRLLEEFSPWSLPEKERLEDALLQRFIRAESELNSVQVMTIHKSKGLEFDHVFIPKLHRMSARDDLSLLLFEERLSPEGWHMLMAPIKSPIGESSALYRYLYQEEQARAREENRRVLYVATTRAKKTLHLSFAAASSSASNSSANLDFKPTRGSFLFDLWPWLPEVARSAQEGSSSPVISHIPEPVPQKSLHRIAPEIAPELAPLAPVVPLVPVVPDSDLNHPDWPEITSIKDRAIGIIVHRYLDFFAKNPLLVPIENSSEALGSSYGVAILSQLRALGVEEVTQPKERIIEALVKTLKSETGQWLLASHPEGKSEFKVVQRQGNLVNFYVMDRVFVSERENIQFIIDYKVVEFSPENSEKKFEDFEAFINRMKTAYSPQLSRYANLMRELMKNQGQSREIKAGLFFPLQDLLVWVSL